MLNIKRNKYKNYNKEAPNKLRRLPYFQEVTILLSNNISDLIMMMLLFLFENGVSAMLGHNPLHRLSAAMIEDTEVLNDEQVQETSDGHQSDTDRKFRPGREIMPAVLVQVLSHSGHDDVKTVHNHSGYRENSEGKLAFSSA